jgi:hypothetical protein
MSWCKFSLRTPSTRESFPPKTCFRALWVTPDILDFAPGLFDVLTGDAPPSVDKDLVLHRPVERFVPEVVSAALFMFEMWLCR